MFHDFLNELRVNNGFKSKYVVVSFRLASVYKRNGLFFKVIFFPFFIHYKLVVDFLFGVEIPADSIIGWGFKLSHPKCITIHPKCVIGSNVHIRHGVTIGNKKTGVDEAPVIGDNVEFGCFSSVFGNVNIGAGSSVGAYSFVVNDLPEKSVVRASSSIRKG